MGQVIGFNNSIEDIPGPSTEGAANSSISFHFPPLFFSSSNPDDESITLTGTNKPPKKKIESEETKTPEAETVNLKEASISSGSRKVMESVANAPVITRERKNAMIIDSIKALEKHDGASFEDICEYLGENYQMDTKLMKPYVRKFLKNSVQSGVLEKINEGSGKERFKLAKAPVNSENVQQNLLSKDGMQSKVEKPEVYDLLESRDITEKVVNSPISDMVINSKNEVDECSILIENLEAVRRPNSDVIPETVTTSETVSNIVTKKPAKSAKNKFGVEKSKIIPVETEKVKLVSAPGNKNLKKNFTRPSTSEMVLDSIKALKMLNGATFDDISEHMEEKYQVNMKMLKSHVNKFLKKGVDEGILEKSSGINAEERYKIKKSENGETDFQNIPENKNKSKSATKKLFDLDYFTSKHYDNI